MNQLLHTPEGVRDIYDAECEAKLAMEERIIAAMKSFGYHPIQTPSFEFFDIFGKEIGTTPSKDLFKFFDKEGNTLVLRPDVTPSIARACATCFTDLRVPIRLYYNQNVFINHSDLKGRLKEHTQIGAELIGDDSIDADAEMIALSVQTLLASGLKEFTLSIGHTGFFLGLVEACGFGADEIEGLRDLIINKNFFGLKQELKEKGASPSIIELYSYIGRLFNEPADFQRLYELSKDYPKIYETLKDCERLYDILCAYDLEDYISFEMGLISRYSYYTGIIFSGYTYGSGEPVLSGGRYDTLLDAFGHPAPAIGFAIMGDALLSALFLRHGLPERTNTRTHIFYAENMREEAIRKARDLRREGQAVMLSRIPEASDKREALLSHYEAFHNIILE